MAEFWDSSQLQSRAPFYKFGRRFVLERLHFRRRQLQVLGCVDCLLDSRAALKAACSSGISDAQCAFSSCCYRIAANLICHLPRSAERSTAFCGFYGPTGRGATSLSFMESGTPTGSP